MPAALALSAGLAVLRRRFDAETIAPLPGLEEVCVEDATSLAAGLAFLAARTANADASVDRRLTAFVAPRFWFGERGRPYAQGFHGLGVGLDRILVVTPKTEAEALWALEEVLRSGAARLAVGAVEGASLVATRRLDLIAREAGASVALVRTTPQRNLSAARRRWRLSPALSASDPYDAKASGRARWRAALERSRDGSIGETTLEFDDETLRLRLADGLADHGLALGAGDAGAASLAA
jgi:protein ImuA